MATASVMRLRHTRIRPRCQRRLPRVATGKDGCLLQHAHACLGGGENGWPEWTRSEGEMAQTRPPAGFRGGPGVSAVIVAARTNRVELARSCCRPRAGGQFWAVVGVPVSALLD